MFYLLIFQNVLKGLEKPKRCQNMDSIKIGDQGFWENGSGLGVSRGCRLIEDPVVER